MPNFIKDDELDRQLREAAPYIVDDGFTARLLQSLPVRQAPARLRGTILLAMTVLASMLAYLVSGRGGFVNDLVVRVSELPFIWLLALTFTAGIVVSGLGLTAAVFKTREPGLISR